MSDAEFLRSLSDAQFVAGFVAMLDKLSDAWIKWSVYAEAGADPDAMEDLMFSVLAVFRHVRPFCGARLMRLAERHGDENPPRWGLRLIDWLQPRFDRPADEYDEVIHGTRRDAHDLAVALAADGGNDDQAVVEDDGLGDNGRPAVVVDRPGNRRDVQTDCLVYLGERTYRLGDIGKPFCVTEAVDDVLKVFIGRPAADLKTLDRLSNRERPDRILKRLLVQHPECAAVVQMAAGKGTGGYQAIVIDGTKTKAQPGAGMDSQK
jgi:hypothetical protein